MHKNVEDIPVELEVEGATLHEEHFGEMNVGYELFEEHLETDEMFKDLPDGRCQSPHWGYIFEGEMTIRYADEEETVEAREVYHMRPGHNVTVEAGTKLIEFSPVEGPYEETLGAAERSVE